MIVAGKNSPSYAYMKFSCGERALDDALEEGHVALPGQYGSSWSKEGSELN